MRDFANFSNWTSVPTIQARFKNIFILPRLLGWSSVWFRSTRENFLAVFICDWFCERLKKLQNGKTFADIHCDNNFSKLCLHFPNLILNVKLCKFYENCLINNFLNDHFLPDIKGNYTLFLLRIQVVDKISENSLTVKNNVPWNWTKQTISYVKE